MKLDRFINRPVLSTVISILIVILGAIGLATLPITQYPDIAPPTVSVRATYTGASASTVLNSVIAPLEEQINGVENMMYMTSNASNTGAGDISIYFKQGTDPDMAAVNVQNRVSMAQGLLPAEVTKVGVTTQKRQTSMLVVFSLYDESDTYTEAFIENYAKINLIPQVQRVPGVGDASVMGQDYSMRIWLRPDVMAQYKLVPGDVSAALAEQNVEAAPGQFGERSNQTFQYTIRYKGRLRCWPGRSSLGGPPAWGAFCAGFWGSAMALHLPGVQPLQSLQQKLQILAVVVFQLDPAFFASVGDVDLPAQPAGEILFRLPEVEGQAVPRLLRRGLLFPLEGLDQCLRLADREPVGNDLLGGLPLELRRGGAQQGTGVAGGELFLLHQLQEVLREGQQPQGIGDGRPGFSHPIRHLFLCEAVFLHQHLIAPGLFGRVQVLSLEVLDQAQLHHFAVIRLNDDCRHLRQAGQLGGPPASLTGDDLVVAGGQTAHCQRLDDTVDPDRLCQIGQGILVKALPGLIHNY